VHVVSEELKMSRKWTLKYGLAAVLVAIVVIAVALLANPLYFATPGQTSASKSFLVMLTDPPTVPAGTTVLNLTYSNVLLEIYNNGTSYWLPVAASGTIDLFSLVDMSQTIASASIPSGSTVDKIEFTILSVDAEVNGTMYNVTPLSNTLVVSIANSQVNPTLSGVLVDFNPTLVQIQATDSDGNIVYYYVLVPSASATVVTDLTSEQVKVGSIVELGQNDREKLVKVVEEFTNNVTIISASLSVNGNVTSLSVTIMNQGNIAFRIFGLTLKGEFNATRTWETVGSNGQMISETYVERIHPDTIPFQVNGTSLNLIPLFGDRAVMDAPSLILQPGQNATLSFSGIIELQPDMGTVKQVSGTLWMILAPIVVTPIVEDTYTAKLVGAGYQPFNVTAMYAP
jgi:type VI protein secretion system component Hcp